MCLLWKQENRLQLSTVSSLLTSFLNCISAKNSFYTLQSVFHEDSLIALIFLDEYDSFYNTFM